MVLTYSVCNVSVLPLKKEPSHRSEQVSQLLFGEKAEVLEINERDWALIRTDWDQYEGWCRASQLQLVPKREYLRQPKYLAAGTMDRYQFEDGDIWVPRGAQVYKSSLLMHGMKGKFKGKKVKTKELKADRDRVKEAALSYMYAPYLWGGKTIAGIDCSGLSHMAYRLCNLRIPRDANEQANAGEVVDFLQHAEPGDLAFF